MRLHLAALVTGSAVILAACAEQPNRTVSGPELNNSQAICNFRLMADPARSYFQPSDWPAVKTLVSQMETFYLGGDLNKATNTGFDILAMVEAVTNVGSQRGSPQNGSAFVNTVLACMTVAPPAPVDFSGPLGPGGFAVRGGPGDPPGPVLSLDGLSGVGLQEATWPGVFGRRVLLYGQPNPGAVFNEVVVGPPYEWSTIPAMPVINPGAVIGFCVTNPGAYRVEESHPSGPHAILSLRNAGNFLVCPAMSPNALGPVGGSAGGFSDFSPVDAGALNGSYVSQPSTVVAGQVITPAVRILVAGNGGTPLPQVKITLSLVQLSGSGTLSGTLVKETGPSGIETFPDLKVSQPGTYALVATMSLLGYPTVQVQSASFTVTP